MTRPVRLPDVGQDGNPLPEIDPTSDVAQLIYLLEVARLRGYRIGPTVQIGTLTVQVKDLRQTEGKGGGEEPDRGIWAEAGYEGP